MVAVAQLVRAPDCGSGGRGFDPHQPPVNNLFGFNLFLHTLNMTAYCISQKDSAFQL